MKIKVLAALILVLFMVGGAYAANTVNAGQGRLTITLDSDFDWSAATITAGRNVGMKVDDAYPEGIALMTIMFVPSAAADVMVVRDGGLTGPEMFQETSVAGGSSVMYFDGGKFYKPYVEYDNLTLGTAANARLIFYFQQ